jgi:DNA-binding transcriptional regulator/RsmH inhibitor MraZ
MTLPAFARTTLSRRASPGRVFLGLHQADTCLVAIDPGELAELRSNCERPRVADEGEYPDQSHARLRRVFGSMDDLWVRDSGRIEIPPVLLKRAALDHAALVIGTGASFELWNPQLALDAGDPDLRALAAFHLDVRQAA